MILHTFFGIYCSLLYMNWCLICVKSGNKDVIKLSVIFALIYWYFNIFILLAYKYIFKWCFISTKRKLYLDTAAAAAAAAAKLLQSCPTVCDLIDGSPPGSRIPGILWAKTLEWVAISFSNAWKWKVKVKTFGSVGLLAIPWTSAYQAPPSMGFSGKSTGVGCHCLLRI